MDDTQKRETFIALRARKQGHRVAAKIGYPHMDLPEFHREPRDVGPLDIEWPGMSSTPEPPQVEPYPDAVFLTAILVIPLLPALLALLILTAN